MKGVYYRLVPDQVYKKLIKFRTKALSNEIVHH